MITYSSNDFYVGLKIIMEGEPYLVESNEFVKPGKGQAFVRVKLRRLLTGTRIEKTFKSTDTVEGADVSSIDAIYLYNDNEFWYFINQENFEQFFVDKKIIGDNVKWLSNQVSCTLTLWKEKPIAVTLPNFVQLEVINTDPGLKGNTVCSVNKIATLSTGATIKVPSFIQIGEIIKIDTRSGEYISRIR